MNVLIESLNSYDSFNNLSFHSYSVSWLFVLSCFFFHHFSRNEKNISLLLRSLNFIVYLTTDCVHSFGVFDLRIYHGWRKNKNFHMKKLKRIDMIIYNEMVFNER